MQNPAKQIIETRLQSWKLFFESEQSAASGRGPLLAGNDPRLIYVGAPLETHCVDAVIDAAIETGDLDLIDLAELVDMMAVNNILQTNNTMHAALMQDEDDTQMGPVAGTRAARITMAELEAALRG